MGISLLLWLDKPVMKPQQEGDPYQFTVHSVNSLISFALCMYDCIHSLPLYTLKYFENDIFVRQPSL